MIKKNNYRVYFSALCIFTGFWLNELQSRVEEGRRAFRFRSVPQTPEYVYDKKTQPVHDSVVITKQPIDRTIDYSDDSTRKQNPSIVNVQKKDPSQASVATDTHPGTTIVRGGTNPIASQRPKQNPTTTVQKKDPSQGGSIRITGPGNRGSQGGSSQNPKQNPSGAGSSKPHTKPPYKRPPARIPSSSQAQDIQTMDLVLEGAGDITTRNDAVIKKALEQYIKGQVFDDTASLSQLDQRLIDAHYNVGSFFDKGSLVQQVKHEDTVALLDQQPTDRLLIQQEMYLYAKTAGTPFSLLSANLHLFPSVIHDQIASLSEPRDRAQAMGKVVMKFKNKFDVVVAQEAWDKSCRDIFYNEIKSIYKHRIEDNYQSYLATLELGAVLGSGLAVYSKYPFETITTLDGKEQNYLLEAFSDYRGDGVFAHKGFLLVKIIKDDIPVYVVTTHLQAGDKDWDSYVSQGDPDSRREVALQEMEQIKSAIRFTIMHDYYESQLKSFFKVCKTDGSGVQNYFNQYVFNMGKKVKGEVVNSSLDSKAALECVMQQIKDFTKKQSDFWSQAYIFIAGNFGIGNDEMSYQDILKIFGDTSETILGSDEHKGTTYKDLKKGVPEVDHRVDHIFSIGKKPAVATDRTVIGGSYVSDIFNHTHTDHLALGFFAKLVK